MCSVTHLFLAFAYIWLLIIAKKRLLIVLRHLKPETKSVMNKKNCSSIWIFIGQLPTIVTRMRNSKPQCWFYNNKLIFWTQLDVYPSVGSIRISFIISLTQTLNFKCFKRVTVLRLKRKTTDRKIKPVDLMTMQGKTILPFRLDIINPPSFVVLGKGERVSFLTWYQPVLKFRSLVWRFGQGTVVSKNRLSVHYEAQKWF